MMATVTRGRAPVRATVSKRPEFQYKSFPAPTNGLFLSANLADMPPLTAIALVNGVVTPNTVRVRGGSLKVATIGNAVESLFSYRSGITEKHFAAGGPGIFEITNVADPNVAPAADVVGQTSAEYSVATFANVAGRYIFACNGTDDVLRYDGTTWTNPAITGPASADLSQCFAYRNRMYFIEKETLKFHYLATNAITGAATAFELGGVFKRGGNLLFGSRWSQDAGDGLDDKAVFVTDQGEIAIYQGSDPSDATNWNLVGRYDITKPLGKNAFTHAGGDLVVMTENGMVPISSAIQKEPDQIELGAISYPIKPLWDIEVAQRLNQWQVEEFPRLGYAVVSLPGAATLPKKCFVVSLQTSRWSVFEGWDTLSINEFQNNGYFGARDGNIYQMEVGGSDDGSAYLFQCALAPDHLNSPGLQKTMKMGRVTFQSRENFRAAVSVSVNYTAEFGTPENAQADIGQQSVWDTGLWDSAIWDGGVAQTIRTRWQSLGRSGFSATMLIQATISNTVDPKAELVTVDMSYVLGELHS